MTAIASMLLSWMIVLFSLAEMKTVKQVKGYLIIMVIIDYTLQHQREKSYIVQKLKQVKALTEHAQQHVTWIMASSPHFNHIMVWVRIPPLPPMFGKFLFGLAWPSEGVTNEETPSLLKNGPILQTLLSKSYSEFWL